MLAALTTSFAAISLGAAFGVLAERDGGALKGILSTSLISAVTGGFGGTKVQCSGPTAPMTAVTTELVQYAQRNGTFDHLELGPEFSVEKYINMVLLMVRLAPAPTLSRSICRRIHGLSLTEPGGVRRRAG